MNKSIELFRAAIVKSTSLRELRIAANQFIDEIERGSLLPFQYHIDAIRERHPLPWTVHPSPHKGYQVVLDAKGNSVLTSDQPLWIDFMRATAIAASGEEKDR